MSKMARVIIIAVCILSAASVATAFVPVGHDSNTGRAKTSVSKEKKEASTNLTFTSDAATFSELAVAYDPYEQFVFDKRYYKYIKSITQNEHEWIIEWEIDRTRGSN